MAEEILRLEHVCKYYTGSSTVVMGLNDLSLAFHRGEFVAITGESGSGKSTLAHVLSGILPYESGEMYFMGKPTSHFDGSDYAHYRRDHISFISQSYGILPGCSVLENVVSALRLSGTDKADALSRAEEILQEVELFDLRSRKAGKLSSGQKQRLSIARALAKPAPILIADEPTGNLDPENSEKIMQLLSRAAKNRLVILITHEFSEAENVATRHISLQDGKLIMDTQLAPSATCPPREAKGKPQKFLSSYVSRLQLSGRPVWSALVLLFFTLTAFAVFAFLGNFIIALDDTHTRVYDNSAFRNGNQSRIVAVRTDGAPMTQTDYNTILSLEYIASLECHGYVTDVNCGYRENVDYKWKHTAVDEGTWDNPQVSMSSSVQLTDKAGFLQTLPLLPEGQAFLTAGRLPQKLTEVVMAGDENLIGTTMPVVIQDVKHWNISALITLQVEVVGVTDHGEGLYFHDSLGKAFTHYTVHENRSWFYLPCEDLQPGEVRFNDYVSKMIQGQIQCLPGTVRSEAELAPADLDKLIFLKKIDNGDLTQSDALWRTPIHTSMLNLYAQVSEEDYEKLVWAQASDQVSITIEDYAYTDRVLEALRQAGYNALSPFREGSTEKDPALEQERLQTLKVCGAALLAIVALQIIVLRALFGTQTESYRLLSNIGLTCPTARLSLLWQVLLFTALGQLLGLGGIGLCSALGVERIRHVVRYLPGAYVLLLSAVHLLSALIAALWVQRSITAQVFPLDRKATDLNLEEVTA